MAIRKWSVLALVYVGLVVAGYSLMTGQNPLASDEMEHGGHTSRNSGQEENTNHEGHNEEELQGTTEHQDDNKEGHQDENEEIAHDHGHGHEAGSEVKTSVTYDDGQLLITVKDETGAVPELEIEHEKEMHFILVSNDLEAYYHLHPEKEVEIFRASQALEEGTYQAFIDLVPVNKTYAPVADLLQVGAEKTAKAQLHADEEWTKEIDGRTVTLEEVEIEAGEEVPLVFTMHDDQPEAHLGALGHVVIIDEGAKEYIHVHPTSYSSTTFNAHFTNPGLYKVWAEFKFDGEIHVYPFILEVQESEEGEHNG